MTVDVREQRGRETGLEWTLNDAQGKGFVRGGALSGDAEAKLVRLELLSEPSNCI